MENLKSQFNKGYLRYLIAISIVALCTILCLPLREKVAPVSLTMIYLTGVVIAAARLGIGPSIFSSILSVLSFNFFFTKPYHSLTFYDESYYFTFSMMLLTSLIVGSMTAKLSQLVEISRKEEKETHFLFDFAKGLSELKNQEAMIEFSKNFFKMKTNFAFKYIENNHIDLSFLPNQANDNDIKAVKIAIEENEISGMGTKNTPSAKGIYFPLQSAAKSLGCMGLVSNMNAVQVSKSQILIFETLASLLSNSLLRAKANEEAAQNRIETENERLRNVLLSSLSHDLRTPLTVMNGSVSNLLKYRKTLPREGVNELTTLWHQLNRLQKFVSDLLRMASISAGKLKLNQEDYTIQEIIGSAILQIEPNKQSRKILSSIIGQIPFVLVDGALIEQVIINLLENAIKHTNDDGIINIEISRKNGFVQVKISDNGEGIPDNQENLIFEKFNTNSDRQLGGTGLGLAICKGIISAHGGQISAKNNAPDKGASFIFTIPISGKANDE